ncbi:MAG: hypothetical protein M1825_000284 [Sarcosagium campestre]|nr:MAG: hypothetical protein M1825_000284 [Sarcosagium campestre]
MADFISRTTFAGCVRAGTHAIARRGENGVGPGAVPFDHIVWPMMAAFLAIGYFNCIDIWIQVFSIFKRWTGLYFWSMIGGSVGILWVLIANTLRFFVDGSNWVMYTTFTIVGWYGMIIGQSLVLFSRLHLVVRNPRILLGVRIMIFTGFVLFLVPTTIMLYGSNSPHADFWLPKFGIMERTQLCGFLFQETVINLLYIWATFKILKPSYSIRVRKILWFLIWSNVVIILMDIGVIFTEFTDFYDLQGTLKPCVYSIKLKLEFAILNQLMFIAKRGLTRKSSPKDTSLYGKAGAGTYANTNSSTAKSRDDLRDPGTLESEIQSRDQYTRNFSRIGSAAGGGQAAVESRPSSRGLRSPMDQQRSAKSDVPSSKLPTAAEGNGDGETLLDMLASEPPTTATAAVDIKGKVSKWFGTPSSKPIKVDPTKDDLGGLTLGGHLMGSALGTAIGRDAVEPLSDPSQSADETVPTKVLINKESNQNFDGATLTGISNPPDPNHASVGRPPRMAHQPRMDGDRQRDDTSSPGSTKGDQNYPHAKNLPTAAGEAQSNTYVEMANRAAEVDYHRKAKASSELPNATNDNLDEPENGRSGRNPVPRSLLRRRRSVEAFEMATIDSEMPDDDIDLHEFDPGRKNYGNRTFWVDAGP